MALRRCLTAQRYEARAQWLLLNRNEHFEAQPVCPGGLDRPWTRRQDVACNTAPPGAAVPSDATVSSDATLLQQAVDAERLHSSARGARG